MDYQKHYNALIIRAKNRHQFGYTETHHIVPRCMGGTDNKDNLVELTPEEHYIAHQLLVKLYPNNVNLIRAASMMCTNRPTNKLYGWIRRRHSEIQSSLMSGSGNTMYNKRWVSNEYKTILVEKEIAEHLLISKSYIQGKKAKRAPCGCLVRNRCIEHEQKRKNAALRKKEEFIKHTTKMFEEFKNSNIRSITEFARIKNTSQPALTRVWKKYIPEYAQFAKPGKSFKDSVDNKK